MIRYAGILALIVVVLASCEKAEPIEHETLTPLPYLPVYPGSSWTYVLDGKTIVETTASDYELHSYNSREHQGRKTEPKFVPMWKGQPIYGYSSPKIFYDLENMEESSNGLAQTPFLSEHTTEEFILSNAADYYSVRKTVAWDQIMMVDTITYNEVVVVNDYYQYKNPPDSEPVLFKIHYYAKGIGLIGFDEVINAGQDTVPNMRLVRYNINKPN